MEKRNPRPSAPTTHLAATRLVRVRPQWPFTTCLTAMRPTPRDWRTITRSATTIISPLWVALVWTASSFFFGDALWFQDQNGNLVPPHNQMTFLGGPVDEIENPNPVSGTNNWWIQDGYGGFGNNGASTGVYGGGSYSNCSDASQP